MSDRLRVRVFVEPQQGATYDDQLAMARDAERLGFDAFFRSDHFLHMAGDGLPGPTDSWITLAGIARETSRIRLGTLLTSATFRHPGLLAIAVAEVDAMSGGRVELGLGAGWFEREHLAYGVPFPASVTERFDRLAEQLEILTGLWTTPLADTFDFTGAHYRVEASPARPKPVQSPHPPIIVGGSGATRTPTLAVRFADEFNVPPFQSVADAATHLQRVQRACEEAGRDPATLRRSVAFPVFCGADDAEVAHRLRAAEGAWSDMAVVAAVGGPEQVVDRCREYAGLGADTVYFQLLDLHDRDHLALLAAEVLPHL